MTNGLHAMRALVDDLPGQLERGWRRARNIDLPASCADAEAVVIAGMGGSAIGGGLAAAAFADELEVPVTVVRDYRLPGWVGDRTLLVASSFSGNTEETLSTFAEAGRRGLARVAVTSGGALAEAARSHGVPLVTLSEAGPPRAALGESLSAICGVLAAAGAMPDPSPEVEASVERMRALVRREAGWPSGTEADRVATLLAGRIPLVVAPEGAAPVARRWKTQLNENSKSAANWDTLPEMDHNTIVGYEHPDGLESRSAVLFLVSPSVPERMSRRIAVTAALLDDAGIPHCRVLSAPGPRLAEALWLVQLGDIVSLRIARIYGVDPLPVRAIDRLKAAIDDPGGAP